jgi:hypothetical protein
MIKTKKKVNEIKFYKKLALVYLNNIVIILNSIVILMLMILKVIICC